MAVNAKALDNKKALNYGLQAEEIALKINNYQSQFDAQSAIAFIYQTSLSDYSNALAYQLKAETSAEKTGSLKNQSISWGALAIIYSAIGDQKNADLYFKKQLMPIKN